MFFLAELIRRVSKMLPERRYNLEMCMFSVDGKIFKVFREMSIQSERLPKCLIYYFQSQKRKACSFHQ